mmetsp:Transcript_52145/g.156512  ORF Transcript_52145/g.156512 Transcript_52145/m.156512 type:complete len:287 (-) Transcript_52145:1019-1879(-)
MYSPARYRIRGARQFRRRSVPQRTPAARHRPGATRSLGRLVRRRGRRRRAHRPHEIRRSFRNRRGHRRRRRFRAGEAPRSGERRRRRTGDTRMCRGTTRRDNRLRNADARPQRRRSPPSPRLAAAPVGAAIRFRGARRASRSNRRFLLPRRARADLGTVRAGSSGRRRSRSPPPSKSPPGRATPSPSPYAASGPGTAARVRRRAPLQRSTRSPKTTTTAIRARGGRGGAGSGKGAYGETPARTMTTRTGRRRRSHSRTTAPLTGCRASSRARRPTGTGSTERAPWR